MAAYPAPLIQELQIMETSFYLAAAGAALVVYDQVLRFSHEVNLVWLRRWSFMTALYLIARYFGSLFVIRELEYQLDLFSACEHTPGH
ncbi:hypothetical protein BJ138DRAFT_444293 [Hygrophoropsis aurantiaca]|uniref:Uncharacterized protein n=1 Tax=Hygrophoropsis aurantiaca TaxID=72124 RepID=A0ACB8A3E9_9AGAM|nr:hypothetical protein BJ138DRAFT_444293 [Hygrophoropsis aurantiaca]